MLLAGFVRFIFELVGEGVEVFERGSFHHSQRFGVGIFGGDLQVAADVMGRELVHVLGG